MVRRPVNPIPADDDDDDDEDDTLLGIVLLSFYISFCVVTAYAAVIK
jgi:hypothetical protein